jgi:hypothetical protein
MERNYKTTKTSELIRRCNYNQETNSLKSQKNSTYPDADYPDRLGPSGKFVVNSTKLTCLEITGYRVKYRAVL